MLLTEMEHHICIIQNTKRAGYHIATLSHCHGSDAVRRNWRPLTQKYTAIHKTVTVAHTQARIQQQHKLTRTYAWQFCRYKLHERATKVHLELRQGPLRQAVALIEVPRKNGQNPQDPKPNSNRNRRGRARRRKSAELASTNVAYNPG